MNDGQQLRQALDFIYDDDPIWVGADQRLEPTGDRRERVERDLVEQVDEQRVRKAGAGPGGLARAPWSEQEEAASRRVEDARDGEHEVII